MWHPIDQIGADPIDRRIRNIALMHMGQALPQEQPRPPMEQRLAEPRKLKTLY
jgi:hypothetical protein